MFRSFTRRLLEPWGILVGPLRFVDLDRELDLENGRAPVYVSV